MSDQIQVTRKARYTTIDNPILYDGRIGKHELLVYLVLSRFANGNAQAWPTAATIAELSRISRATVFRALEVLESVGYITRETRKTQGLATRYFLVDQYEIPAETGGPRVSQGETRVSQGETRVSQGETGGVSQGDGGCLRVRHITIPNNNTKEQEKSFASAPEAVAPGSQSWSTPEGELVGRFFREFQRVTGGWTTGPMGNELAQARDIIARMGAEKAGKALEAFFAGDWWFTWNKAKTKRVWTWGSFVKNLEEIACELAGEASAQKPMAIIKTKAEKCPSCGKTWDPIYDICAHCGHEKEHPHAL